MALLSNYTTLDIYTLNKGIPLTVTLLLLWVIGKIVYRLFFHPLAGFPGPKLAALTGLVEFYHDGIRGGQYTFEIAHMHKTYGTYLRKLDYSAISWSTDTSTTLILISIKGPVVRISPDELHVNDPEFINELYGGVSTKRDRYEFAARQFGLVFPLLCSIKSNQSTEFRR